MNNTRLAVTLIACLAGTQLHANIVELSQGTQIYQVSGYPKAFPFFDEATVIPLEGSPTDKGWVSLYGALNGGTLFDTDLFALDPTATANLWWDFGDSGYKLSYVVVNDGQDNTKIYQIGGANFRLDGSLILNAFDGARIETVDLYGRLPGQPAPESGMTFLLLFIGIVTLLALNNTPRKEKQ